MYSVAVRSDCGQGIGGQCRLSLYIRAVLSSVKTTLLYMGIGGQCNLSLYIRAVLSSVQNYPLYGY